MDLVGTTGSFVQIQTPRTDSNFSLLIEISSVMMRYGKIPNRLLLLGWLTTILSSTRGFIVPQVATMGQVSVNCKMFLETDSISTAEVVSTGSNLSRSLTLGGVPALGMAVTTLVGLRVRTPPSVVGALQHFSAGILLTTVAKELLPEMVQAEGLLENLASGVGFFAGVGLLIGLGQVLEKDEGEEVSVSLHDEMVSKENNTTDSEAARYRLRNRRMSLAKN